MANITARELVHSVGLNTAPEVYYYRGAVTRDLDGEKLAKIHQKIKEELGDEAAKAFVTMVQNVKLLSARKFLESIYALEENGWKYLEAKQREINESRTKTKAGNLEAIYEYYANLRNDTDFIRNSFLANINEKHDSLLLRFELCLRAERGDDYFCDFSDDNDDDDDYEEYE